MNSGRHLHFSNCFGSSNLVLQLCATVWGKSWGDIYVMGNVQKANRDSVILGSCFWRSSKPFPVPWRFAATPESGMVYLCLGNDSQTDCVQIVSQFRPGKLAHNSSTGGIHLHPKKLMGLGSDGENQVFLLGVRREFVIEVPLALQFCCGSCCHSSGGRTREEKATVWIYTE